MSDRELLEWAAKAIGLPINKRDGFVWVENVGSSKRWGLWRDCATTTAASPNPRCLPIVWNPLTDDGDALRLAVKLRLDIHFEMNGLAMSTAIVEVLDATKCFEEGYAFCATEDCTVDPYAATRRAIVRAAAEIGRAAAQGEKP